MRITQRQLRQIIKEELRRSTNVSSRRMFEASLAGEADDEWTGDGEVLALEYILPEIISAIEGVGTYDGILLDAIDSIKTGNQLDIIDRELKKTKGESFRDYVFKDLIFPVKEHETIQTIIKHLNSLEGRTSTWSYNPNVSPPRNPVSQNPKY